MDTVFNFIGGVITFFSSPQPQKRRSSRPTHRVVRKTSFTFPSVQERYEARNRSPDGESPTGTFQQPEPHRSPDSHLAPSPSAITSSSAIPPSVGPQRHRDQARDQRKRRLQRTVTVLGLADVPAGDGLDICPSSDNLKTELGKLGKKPTNEDRVRADELQRQIVDRDFVKALRRQRSLVARAAAWAEECRKKQEAPASSIVASVTPPVVLSSAAVRESVERDGPQREQQKAEPARKKAERDQAGLRFVPPPPRMFFFETALRENAERDRLDRERQKAEEECKKAEQDRLDREQQKAEEKRKKAEQDRLDLEEQTRKEQTEKAKEAFERYCRGTFRDKKGMTLLPELIPKPPLRSTWMKRHSEAITDICFFERYDAKWAELLQNHVSMRPPMDFLHLPWPVFEEVFRPELITPDLVQRFVFHPMHRSVLHMKPRARIAEQLWRYEAENFESMVVSGVASDSKNKARKAAAEVHRILMDLFHKS